jgi:sulfatase maturation enzyme AslB (radical SAM superfamily)
MITQVCNLSCLGCTNYSDLKHTGYVGWEQGSEWITRWLTRIDIADFGIMGGEPLINPECRDWLIGVRQLLPHSQIRFTTNALLLEQHWDLIDLMHDLGNVIFKITVHVSNDKIQHIINRIFDRYNWQPINEFGIDRWITGDRFRFHVKTPKTFIKTYRGTYHDMRPYNSNPVDAFANCCQQTCPLLHQGRIFKCSTSGLLHDTVARMAPSMLAHWQQYFDPGISPESDQIHIDNFLQNFGKFHQRCGQCPTTADNTSRIDHLRFVKSK